MQQRHGAAASSCVLPTAPSTPEPETIGVKNESHQPLVEKCGALALSDTSTVINMSGYPTPPVSSASSFTQKDSDRDESPGGNERSPEGSGAGNSPKERKKSVSCILPLSSRRHTAGLKSLSGISSIVTNPSIHAAHLSNPTTTRASTTPTTPTRETPPTSALSSLTANMELSKLTDSVAHASRKKSTPPLTPRALSASGTDGAPKSPAPTSKLHQNSSNEAFVSPEPSQPAKAAEDTINPADVKPPKGKLFVKISEARGLKPSHEPYVVCVFEWNEYITKGPKTDGTDKEKEEPKDISFGGMPIKRSGSDMGRSIAIPMKSRQNSTTSLSDQRNSKGDKQVTDPKWEHEVTL